MTLCFMPDTSCSILVSIMHALKSIAHWVAIGFLSLWLVLALVVLPVSMHLTNRQTIKSWVGDTQLLEGVSEIIPVFLAQTQEEEEEGQDSDSLSQLLDQSGIDTTVLADASEEVITPEYVRQKLFPVIDGIYDWLEGDTSSPIFDIVISDRLTALADNLSGPLTSELNKLPECPPGTPLDSEFNPIVAQCLPAGVVVDQAIDDFSKSLTDFGDTPDIAISSDEMEWDEETLETVPKVYSVVNYLPLYLGGLILVFSVLVVVLAKSLPRGLKRVSWSFIINGALVGISFWLLGAIDQLTSVDDSDMPQSLVDNLIEPFLEIVIGEIARTGVMISLISISIGAAIWLATFMHHKITHSHDGYAKVRDTTPSEKSETKYINKISK